MRFSLISELAQLGLIRVGFDHKSKRTNDTSVVLRVFLATFLFLLIFNPVAVAKRYKYFWSKAKKKTRVYAGRSARYRTRGRIYKGQSVLVLKKRGSWFLIRFRFRGKKRYGWVRQWYVVPRRKKLFIEEKTEIPPVPSPENQPIKRVVQPVRRYRKRTKSKPVNSHTRVRRAHKSGRDKRTFGLGARVTFRFNGAPEALKEFNKYLPSSVTMISGRIWLKNQLSINPLLGFENVSFNGYSATAIGLGAGLHYSFINIEKLSVAAGGRLNIFFSSLKRDSNELDGPTLILLAGELIAEYFIVRNILSVEMALTVGIDVLTGKASAFRFSLNGEIIAGFHIYFF